MMDMKLSTPATIKTIILSVRGRLNMEGVEVVVGAPDGIPVAVTVGAVLVCEGRRELATADNDCSAAFVIFRHRASSWFVLVPF